MKWRECLHLAARVALMGCGMGLVWFSDEPTMQIRGLSAMMVGFLTMDD